MLVLSVALPFTAVTLDWVEDWVAIMEGRCPELARISTMPQQDLAPLAGFLSHIDSLKGATVAKLHMASSSSVSKDPVKIH